MRILLDTQCWLWSLLSPDRLNARAQSLFEELRHPLYLSAASSWEIAIKAQLGRLKLPEPVERYVPSRLAEQGITAVPVEHAHALAVAALPAEHADPFDRLLVAQARLERMSVLTADPAFSLYGVDVIWAARGEPPLRPPGRPRRRG